jgi:hypothetical protein
MKRIFQIFLNLLLLATASPLYAEETHWGNIPKPSASSGSCQEKFSRTLDRVRYRGSATAELEGADLETLGEVVGLLRKAEFSFQRETYYEALRKSSFSSILANNSKSVEQAERLSRLLIWILENYDLTYYQQGQILEFNDEILVPISPKIRIVNIFVTSEMLQFIQLASETPTDANGIIDDLDLPYLEKMNDYFRAYQSRIHLEFGVTRIEIETKFSEIESHLRLHPKEKPQLRRKVLLLLKMLEEIKRDHTAALILLYRNFPSKDFGKGHRAISQRIANLAATQEQETAYFKLKEKLKNFLEVFEF